MNIDIWQRDLKINKVLSDFYNFILSLGIKQYTCMSDLQ